MIQNLSNFKLPPNFRGKNFIYVQIWWAVQKIIFNNTPQFMYGLRTLLLRFFGAKIGKNVLIRPSVKITYPWKVSIGNNSWIGDDVVLYSLGEIRIGENSVISQKSYVCTGDHDYNDENFRIRSKPTIIEDEVWIATDCYISPGITIGRGSVIGARSSVFKNMPSNYVCIGSPCKPIKKRVDLIPYHEKT